MPTTPGTSTASTLPWVTGLAGSPTRPSVLPPARMDRLRRTNCVSGRRSYPAWTRTRAAKAGPRGSQLVSASTARPTWS